MGCYSPLTPKQIAATVCIFVAGAALFAAGAHLSYVNVGPQRARTLARDEFVREHLRRKYGYGNASLDLQVARFNEVPPGRALELNQASCSLSSSLLACRCSLLPLLVVVAFAALSKQLSRS
ncbi:hypothetical protein BHE74_00038976 [Ensete ventricosum]|nr:hypothetical protein BHE74_00038976 [Ensete ventricosum]RZR79042.1 hypothetical protein BHM03_00004621 [Ensete ventricosum]